MFVFSPITFRGVISAKYFVLSILHVYGTDAIERILCNKGICDSSKTNDCHFINLIDAFLTERMNLRSLVFTLLIRPYH